MTPLWSLAGQAYGRIADAQVSRGNQVRLLRDGPQAFPAWLDAIAGARHRVHLENYIIQEDATGQAFADAIIAAAGRGARCRVLYDWLGCRSRSSAAFWRQFDRPGVELRCYNSPHPLHPVRWVSRDHRKVLCVDGEVAFTGGLCIGHDWMGDASRNIPPWRDTAIEIRGPAVAAIDAAFADSWQACGAAAWGAEALPEVARPGEGGVEISVIAGRPGAMALYRLEQLVAELAQTSLWLTDGYFVATTAYVRALAGAARAGVDVRLLVPGSSNWPVVGALSQSAFRPLLEAGVRVFEWNGAMVHAKTAVADGCWSRIGSSNSNLASWVSNRELDVTVSDPNLAAQMAAMFEADMENSTEILLTRGLTGISKPSVPGGGRGAPAPRASAGRFFAGAIGLSSTLRATLTQTRVLGAGEALVVLAGGVLLLVMALLGAFLPRLIAWPLAFAAVWGGADLLLRAVRLWRQEDHGKR